MKPPGDAPANRQGGVVMQKTGGANRPEPRQFPCPACGADDWRVEYFELAYQDVKVVVTDAGIPYVDQYAVGDYGHHDGDSRDHELICNACAFVLILADTSEPRPRNDKSIRQQITSATAHRTEEA